MLGHISRVAAILVMAWLWLGPAHADPVYQSQTYACTKAANASLAAAGGARVAPSVSGKQIYVCGFAFWTNGTASTGVQLGYATAGGCAAGPYTSVTPAMEFAANSGLVDHQSYYEGLLPVPSGSDLCFVETAGVTAAVVYFSQF